MATAANQLLALPGIEAKVRQRVDLFGQHLVGAGHYYQWVQGPQLLLRLDLKLQLGDQIGSLQQISDGQIFWVRTSLTHRNSLTRVNLRKLRKAASELSTPPPPAYWMALGGMPQLLARLAEDCDFEMAEPKTIGHLPVWRIDGQWKPHVLQGLRQATAGDSDDGRGDLQQVPEPMPHGVTLILGRDEVIPLFPYSVSFYRLDRLPAALEESEIAVRRPVATIELYQVRLRPDLTPADFDYRPGNQEVRDQTDQYVARLRQAQTVRSQ